jgi:hypothetical protein
MADLKPKLSPQDVISLVKETQQKRQKVKNDLANANEAVKDAEARQKYMEELEKQLNAE